MSSSDIKPIKVWGKDGPNPPKVVMILNLLSIPHEFVPITFADIKKPEYLAINPNGRLPAIHDSNTDLTIWESGAIVEYLIDRYDKYHKYGFAPGTNDYYLAKQWLIFQVSGQGPYYGQAIWFTRLHQERIPSATERYEKEVGRVTGVLEAHLTEQKKKFGAGNGPWLVGNKLSYADIAFVSWQAGISTALAKEKFDARNYPVVEGWLGKLVAIKEVSDALAVGH